MAFDEVRLSSDIEQGAQGGPGFKTTIITLASGFEQRNQDWQVARGRWQIGYLGWGRSQYEEVRDFFYARRGRARGFRFRDWGDFRIANVQAIGTGDGATTAFQVTKRYSSGGVDYDRALKKLEAGSVRVYLDGIEQGSGFAVDTTTGIVTFLVAPAAGVVVGVTCRFDVPVRFDTDSFDASVLYETEDQADEGRFEAPSIPIVEIRL